MSSTTTTPRHDPEAAGRLPLAMIHNVNANTLSELLQTTDLVPGRFPQ